MKWWEAHPRLILALAISALCLGLYSITYKVPFLYDDLYQIRGNDHIKHGLDLAQILTEEERPTRVIQNITLALNWSWSGEETWSYHFVNAFLHGLSAFAFFLLLLRLEVRSVVAAGTALVFVVLPLNIEAVTYIMGRNDVLRTLSTLAVLLAYLGKHRRPWFVWSLLSLSLLVKETCALNVFLLMAVDGLVDQRPWRHWRWREHAIHLTHVLWLPVIAHFLSYAETHGLYVGFHLFPFWDYVRSNFYYVAFYLYLFFNPGLQSIYHDWIASPPWFGVLAGVMILVALGWMTFSPRMRRRGPWAFMAFFFLLSYLPTGSILQFVNPFAEYRLHLSNLALCFILIGSWLELTIPRTLKLTVFALFCSFCCTFTYLYNGLWVSRLSIWGNAVSLYPKSRMPNMAVGQQLSQDGYCAEAITHFEGICEEFPILGLRSSCHLSAALLHLRLHRPELALGRYKKMAATPMDLRTMTFYKNLLILGDDLGHPEGQQEILDEARRRFPKDFKDWKLQPPNPHLAPCRN